MRVRPAGRDDAGAVHAVVRAAFGARPALDPPADALGDTAESVASALGAHGGLVAERDGDVVGALLLDPAVDRLYLRRVGVLPDEQDHGVASALVSAAVDDVATTTPGVAAVAVLAREELPATVRFWEAHGFVEVAREAPYVRLERPLPAVHEVPDADAMRDLGRRLATDLRAGDLVVLAGGLGAGKTTLAQGLGEGLGVRGGVTSPTFVIARVHPSLSGGPDLVHVDAYRLGGVDELDDLDLDTSLEEAVTVVEWGAGVAEVLSASRLEVRITRSRGGEADPGGAAPADEEDEPDPRRVLVEGFGPRWAGGAPR